MKRAIIGINTDFGDSLYRLSDAYVDCVIAAGGLPLLVPCNGNRRLLDEYIKMADGFLFIGGKDYPPGWYGEKLHPKSVLLHSRRADVDLYLIRAALRRKIPILGICGGHQLINIALGGKIIQYIPNAADPSSPGSWLRRVPQRGSAALDLRSHFGKVGCRRVLHHQSAQQRNGTRKAIKHMVAITRGKILHRLFGKMKIIVNSYHHQATGAFGDGLEAVAFADDGVVEAIESTKLPFVLGLQWHPERLPWRGHAERIFRALIKAACKKS